MQRLKFLVRVRIRIRVRWLQASATMVAGLQHTVHSLELLVRVSVRLTVRARWL